MQSMKVFPGFVSCAVPSATWLKLQSLSHQKQRFRPAARTPSRSVSASPRIRCQNGPERNTNGENSLDVGLMLSDVGLIFGYSFLREVVVLTARKEISLSAGMCIRL